MEDSIIQGLVRPHNVLSSVLACRDLCDHILGVLRYVETPQWHNKGNFNVVCWIRLCNIDPQCLRVDVSAH